MIPKRYFITHKSFHFLQPAAAACVRQMRSVLHDYEEVFFSDGEADAWIGEHYPELGEFWRGLRRGVQRSDFFRLLYVYKMGGFYFDTDVWISRHLDDLRNQSLVFPKEETLDRQEFVRRFGFQADSSDMLDMIGNYAFGAEPLHPFIGLVIQRIVETSGFWPIHGVGDDFVLDTTGPHCLNRAWWEYKASPCFEERRDGIMILEGGGQEDFRWPFSRNPNHYRFGSYATHLMLGRWRGA